MVGFDVHFADRGPRVVFKSLVDADHIPPFPPIEEDRKLVMGDKDRISPPFDLHRARFPLGGSCNRPAIATKESLNVGDNLTM